MGKEFIETNDIDSDDTVALYLRDIGKIPLLSEEEELELAMSVERGHSAQKALDEDIEKNYLTDSERQSFRQNASKGKQAQNTLVGANARFVVSKAKRYASSGIPLVDLIQEGNLGLMRAAEKFDYRKGYRFTTYAGWWVRHAITRYIAKKERSFDQEDSYDEQLEMYGDNIDVDRSAGVDPQKVLYDRQRLQAIERSLQALTMREQKVVEQRGGLYDGEERTLQEVGLNFGLTRERIRQLETGAFAKLREPQRMEPLRDYLGS